MDNSSNQEHEPYQPLKELKMQISEMQKKIEEMQKTIEELVAEKKELVAEISRLERQNYKGLYGVDS